MFKRYKFNSRGIGIISSKIIPFNTLVGNYFTKSEPITIESRFIYNGWVETNPLGRYLNHNRNPNCNLILNKDSIEIYTNREISVFEELTINYMNVVDLIELPESLIDRYSIIDYDYIEEEIIIQKELI
jgi:hypothetical protein